jgi:type II secretory pathway pseudopilin PulG
MIVRKQKAFITLLEVLLVIGILAAVGSITAFNVTKLFREQKALDEMNQVVHLLKTASDLMMMVDFDSEIRFSKKEDKLQVEMVPKSSISPLILPLIPTKPLVLEIVNRLS